MNQIINENPTNITALSEDLIKLGELKEKGLLKEEEFNEQKKKLLKQQINNKQNIKEIIKNNIGLVLKAACLLIWIMMDVLTMSIMVLAQIMFR